MAEHDRVGVPRDYNLDSGRQGTPVDLLERPDHEARLRELGVRKSQGSYYTPADVVDGLLRLCLDPVISELEDRGPTAVAAIRILDPTCGTGNFLLAAFERVRASLLRCGGSSEFSARRALQCVAGVDLDPTAVEVCRALLLRAAGDVESSIVERSIRCADSLVMERHAPLTLFSGGDDGVPDWDSFMSDVDAPAGFDVIVGNPPFLSQLQNETTFAEPYLDAVKNRFGDAARGYVDPAALFLLVGVDLLRTDRGRLCLVEPLSVLSTRGAAQVRRTLLARAKLTAVWFAEAKIFDDAEVDVWAPMLETGAHDESAVLLCGRDLARVGVVDSPTVEDGSWGSLLASRRGVPRRNWRCAGILSDFASASADFRDQYYGLAGHVIDSYEGGVDLPKLVTSGLIDPAALLWGERTTMFNRAKFDAPRVDVPGLSEDLQRWARRRMVPKILLATQTRVLEPVVDVDGSLLPSVPVVSIETPVEMVWHIGAALVSPPIAAIAAARHFGAALSSDALKLSARDVLALPMPADLERWNDAAHAFESASTAGEDALRRRFLVECAEVMCAAYGVAGDHELMQWWTERLPRAAGAESSRTRLIDEDEPNDSFGSGEEDRCGDERLADI